MVLTYALLKTSIVIGVWCIINLPVIMSLIGRLKAQDMFQMTNFPAKSVVLASELIVLFLHWKWTALYPPHFM